MVSRFLIAGDEHEEEESSSESESDVEEVTSEEEGAEEAEQDAEGEAEEGGGASSSGRAGTTPRSTIQQRKISIKLGANVCHVSCHRFGGPLPGVSALFYDLLPCSQLGGCSAPPPCMQVCGERGHSAGFVGAKYLDCPNKPCYLCSGRGHSTMTCPFRQAPSRHMQSLQACAAATVYHACPRVCNVCCCLLTLVWGLSACRIAPGHGCTVDASIGSDTVLSALRKREQGGRCEQPMNKPAYSSLLSFTPFLTSSCGVPGVCC
jgi:hypothetical protein